MKKAYWTTVIIPAVWGIFVTLTAVICFFSFVVNSDRSIILWALGIILGWCVAGLSSFVIAVASYKRLSSEKE